MTHELALQPYLTQGNTLLNPVAAVGTGRPSRPGRPHAKAGKQWQQPQLSWRWAMGMQLDSRAVQIILAAFLLGTDHGLVEWVGYMSPQGRRQSGAPPVVAHIELPVTATDGL